MDHAYLQHLPLMITARQNSESLGQTDHKLIRHRVGDGEALDRSAAALHHERRMIDGDIWVWRRKQTQSEEDCPNSNVKITRDPVLVLSPHQVSASGPRPRTSEGQSFRR